jgi:dihydroflavonol-4-reductase
MYLITGSTGFIGSLLCRALLARGEQVRAFHRSTSSLSGLEGLPVEHAIGDLTQPETIAEAMQGVEYVFHTAAQTGGWDDLKRYRAVSVQGTQAVVEAALRAGVRRLVFTGSGAALGVPETGPREGVALLNEAHTWNLPAETWPYAHAKYLAELEIQQGVAQGLDAVTVLPTYVVGAGDLYRSETSPITLAAQGKISFSVSGGFNVVAVEDVVAGHLAAMQRGRRGERYLLGGQNMTFSNFLKLAANAAGARPPYGELPVGLVRALARPAGWLRPFFRLPVDAELLTLAGTFFYYDTSKSSRELGLAEARPIPEAIQAAWNWFELARRA